MTTIIRIQELSYNKNSNTFQVRLTFLYDGDEDSIDNIAFPNPHTEATEDLMEGYFEKFISTPYDDVPYQSVVQKIEEYGENLFKAFFSSNEAFRLYFNIIQNCTPENVVIEIVAQTPTFQSLYWEAMKAPNELPLAAQGMVIRRKNIRSNIIKAEVKPSPTINLLIVTARPNEDRDVAYRTIQRPLIELIKKSKLKVKAHILRPGTYEAFLKHLDKVGAKHYHIIHFDLHGSLMDFLSYERYYKQAEKADFQRHLFKNPLFKGNYALTELAPYDHKKAFLFFESRKKGVAVPVEAEQLAAVLRQQQVPIIILNACQSAKQDQKDTVNETSLGRILIQQGIQLVLAMRYSVSVTAAKLLMQILYRELYNQTGVEKAIAQARKELYRFKSRRAAYNREIDLEDWILPVVYQNRLPKLQFREFTGDEKMAFVQRSQIPPSVQQHLPYGFFGRDLDILKIEKALLTQRNILLLQGMGGAGKTTLLKYLGKWWLQTGFVEQIFYFGYDEKAYTKTDILNIIARQVFGELALSKWRLQSEAIKEYDIVQAFNTHSYALILDNAESITGAKLAIQHTLNETQKHEVHQFLQQLSGGESKIIIGSRSDEKWLQAGTFGNNHLILSGLDREAAKNFANKIILDLNIPIEFIAKDAYFERLLNLLAGYPLAIKAVLPNLRTKNSRQILEELDKGLEGLDKGNPQSRTESILKCIEYAHSNLSEDAQKVLLCLTPFVGVVNLTPQLIQTYFDELSKHDEFKNYPFYKLPNVIQEAVCNGFMQKVMPNLPMKIMQLQPIFTYFLKNKLHNNQQQVASILTDAYITYCNNFGNVFHKLVNSKNPQEQQTGELLIGLEYENLYRALFLKMEKQQRILDLISPIYAYLQIKQKHQAKIELIEKVYYRMKKINILKLQGELAPDFITLCDLMAVSLIDSNATIKAQEVLLESIRFLQRDLFNKRQYKGILAGFYNKLALVCHEEKKFAKAKRYFEVAAVLYEECQDIEGQASVYQNIGNVFFDEQDYTFANGFYKGALKFFKQLNDELKCATVYHNMGSICIASKDLNTAKDYYEKALEIYIKHQDILRQAKLYQNLANIYCDENKYEISRNYHEKALKIYEFYQEFNRQASVYFNLGNVCYKQKDYTSAIKYYQKSQELFLSFEDAYHYLEALYKIRELPRVVASKAFLQNMINDGKKVFKDNPRVLATLEAWQIEINKIQLQ